MVNHLKDGGISFDEVPPSEGPKNSKTDHEIDKVHDLVHHA